MKKKEILRVMPVKKGKGKGKGKTFEPKLRRPDQIAKDIDSGEVYGQVLKAEGFRRFSVKCQNNSAYNTINCGLKGSFRKRINAGDFVLVQLWDFDKSKGTIIDSYNSAEISKMESRGLWDFKQSEINNDIVSKTTVPSGTEKTSSNDDSFQFMDEEDHLVEANGADDRLGPAALTGDDEFDIDAI